MAFSWLIWVTKYFSKTSTMGLIASLSASARSASAFFGRTVIYINTFSRQPIQSLNIAKERQEGLIWVGKCSDSGICMLLGTPDLEPIYIYCAYWQENNQCPGQKIFSLMPAKVYEIADSLGLAGIAYPKCISCISGSEWTVNIVCKRKQDSMPSLPWSMKAGLGSSYSWGLQFIHLHIPNRMQVFANALAMSGHSQQSWYHVPVSKGAWNLQVTEWQHWGLLYIPPSHISLWLRSPDSQALHGEWRPPLAELLTAFSGNVPTRLTAPICLPWSASHLHEQLDWLCSYHTIWSYGAKLRSYYTTRSFGARLRSYNTTWSLGAKHAKLKDCHYDEVCISQQDVVDNKSGFTPFNKSDPCSGELYRIKGQK